MYNVKLLLALLLGACTPAAPPVDTGAADSGETAGDGESGDSGAGDSHTGDSEELGKSEVRVPMRFVDLVGGAPLAGQSIGGVETDEDGRVSIVLPEGPAAVDLDVAAHMYTRVALYAGQGTAWVPNLPPIDGATVAELWDVSGMPRARNAGLLLVVAARSDGAGGWVPAEGLTLDVEGRYSGSVAQGAEHFVPGNTVPVGGTGVIAFLGTGETVTVTAPAEDACQMWAASSLEPYAVPTDRGDVTVVALRCEASR